MPVFLFVVALVAATNAASATAAKQPNVVLILADDFGVGDIQAHYPDNKIATPALDRLVAEGMSFRDAHSPSAVCSPTRYGLLTGRYAWRTPLQEWVLGAYEPPLIEADRLTLPGLLKRLGYRTACVGKWHLGWNWPGADASTTSERIETPNGLANRRWDFTRPIADGPTTRGFDHYFGTSVPNLPPFTFLEDDRVVVQPTAHYEVDPSQGVNLPGGLFLGKPMAPGWRMDEILPELTRRAVDKVRRSAASGEPFFLYFSLTSPHEPVSPSPRFRGKSGIAPIADFVMETDWAAGEVVRAIDDAGLAEDTIVIFTADNGHSHYTGWDALVAAGHQPSGPYRGHKGDIWEGGHRVPLVVRWPGRIVAGSESDRLTGLTDVYATVAELLAAAVPAHAAEDSLSFARELLGEALRTSNDATRDTLVCHSNHGEFAYRRGPWKLVYRNVAAPPQECRGEPTIAELYHLEDDVAESRDVAADRPEMVAELTEGLRRAIVSGATRPRATGENATEVRFDRTQKTRWAATNDAGG